MMKRTLTASSLMLALAACGGGGDGEGATLASDTSKPDQTAPSTGQPPAAQPPSSTAPAPSPPQASPAPPEGAQPPAAEAPVAQPPSPAPEPPVATPPPSNRPVAAPTSGSWVVVCRQSHDRGGIVMGVVATAGRFSVDDGMVDLTGQPASQQRLVQTDAYNPEVTSQIQYAYGNQAIVLGVGDDTRPRWVGAYDSTTGGTVRQWECSTVLRTIPAAQQALCYASKEPLTKGLGPPVVVGFDWRDSRVFVDRADAPSVRYSLGQARDVTMPFEGRARDGTNLRCW